MWSTPIDIYCERADPSFWAEPVNAITNAAFLVAAAAAFVAWRAAGGRDWAVLALIVLTAVVGLGSFAFHTLATRGAALLDIIPIAAFIYGYLFLALRRFLALSGGLALAVLIAFVALSQALDWIVPPGFLNGSYAYLPALAAMLVVGMLVPYRPHRRALLAAAGIFIVSLLFRTSDEAVCGSSPLGTHFLWHLLNSLVLYVLLRGALQRRPSVV